LIVEIDGGQHAENARDLARTAYLESEGYRCDPFWNNEVLDNADGVLLRILETLKDTPTPNPLPQAVGGFL